MKKEKKLKWGDPEIVNLTNSRASASDAGTDAPICGNGSGDGIDCADGGGVAKR